MMVSLRAVTVPVCLFVLVCLKGERGLNGDGIGVCVIVETY